MIAYINKNEIYKLFSGTPAIARLHVTQIDELPTADVVEVKHGYWIEERYIDEKKSDFKCSVCDFDDTIYRNSINEFYKYCPFCGAKMDGKPLYFSREEENK